jgi:hypothetical protein
VEALNQQKNADYSVSYSRANHWTSTQPGVDDVTTV